MTQSYVLAILGLVLASIIFWYKSNAKFVYGLEWGPFKWWLWTSLITNYLTMYSWWKLVELSDVWRAGVVWGVVTLLVDLTLNACYFSFNFRAVIALGLCALAAAIMHD